MHCAPEALDVHPNDFSKILWRLKCLCFAFTVFSQLSTGLSHFLRVWKCSGSQWMSHLQMQTGTSRLSGVLLYRMFFCLICWFRSENEMLAFFPVAVLKGRRCPTGQRCELEKVTVCPSCLPGTPPELCQCRDNYLPNCKSVNTSKLMNKNFPTFATFCVCASPFWIWHLPQENKSLFLLIFSPQKFLKEQFFGFEDFLAFWCVCVSDCDRGRCASTDCGSYGLVTGSDGCPHSDCECVTPPEPSTDVPIYCRVRNVFHSNVVLRIVFGAFWVCTCTEIWQKFWNQVVCCCRQRPVMLARSVVWWTQELSVVLVRPGYRFSNADALLPLRLAVWTSIWVNSRFFIVLIWTEWSLFGRFRLILPLPRTACSRDVSTSHCGRSCPHGFIPNTDGCPTCSCLPDPKKMDCLVSSGFDQICSQNTFISAPYNLTCIF